MAETLPFPASQLCSEAGGPVSSAGLCARGLTGPGRGVSWVGSWREPRGDICFHVPRWRAGMSSWSPPHSLGAPWKAVGGPGAGWAAVCWRSPRAALLCSRVPLHALSPVANWSRPSGLLEATQVEQLLLDAASCLHMGRVLSWCDRLFLWP